MTEPRSTVMFTSPALDKSWTYVTILGKRIKEAREQKLDVEPVSFENKDYEGKQLIVGVSATEASWQPFLATLPGECLARRSRESILLDALSHLAPGESAMSMAAAAAKRLWNNPEAYADFDLGLSAPFSIGIPGISLNRIHPRGSIMLTCAGDTWEEAVQAAEKMFREAAMEELNTARRLAPLLSCEELEDILAQKRQAGKT